MSGFEIPIALGVLGIALGKAAPWFGVISQTANAVFTGISRHKQQAATNKFQHDVLKKLSQNMTLMQAQHGDVMESIENLGRTMEELKTDLRKATNIVKKEMRDQLASVQMSIIASLSVALEFGLANQAWKMKEDVLIERWAILLAAWENYILQNENEAARDNLIRGALEAFAKVEKDISPPTPSSSLFAQLWHYLELAHAFSPHPSSPRRVWPIDIMAARYCSAVQFILSIQALAVAMLKGAKADEGGGAKMIAQKERSLIENVNKALEVLPSDLIRFLCSPDSKPSYVTNAFGHLAVTECRGE
ncbi:hypothetical protein HDV00_004842 [Rhizophlyctis rosea]|nr:hypothetical protein HDV00_004842 [Rhizophlyctis rosea]